MDNLIDIKIYGDGSRKYPYEVKAISCDRANECSLYKDGRCLRVPGILCPLCCVGTSRIIDRSTKYAKRCHDMLEKYREHDKHNKLKRPLYQYIGLVGDDVLINIPHVRIERDTYNITDPGFGDNIIIIPREKFTPEYVVRLLKFCPHSFSGSPIHEYKEKVVKIALRQIKELMPKLYQKVIEIYPESANWSVDYIGRWAYLTTCNRECTYQGFKFDGDYLVRDDWKSAFLPFDAKSAEVKIKATSDMRVQITDNNQVLETTKFC